MKIIAEYLECDLESGAPGDEAQYEQECSTPEEAAAFVNGKWYGLTPDGHSIDLADVYFVEDGKTFVLSEVAEAAGDDEMADAVSCGYLREMESISDEQMRSYFAAVQQLGKE